MAHRSDQDRIEKTHNLPRFFVEHPQVSWVLLVGVLVWGWFGYHSMPQRKDPDIPVRVAVASCSWPGATAQQVEQFVTRPIEDAVAENKTIHPGTAADYGIRSVVGGCSRMDGLIFSEDRKSTRLNSSHANISYAVFCLKKKKTR